MIQTDLGSLIRTRITPKERSLRQTSEKQTKRPKHKLGNRIGRWWKMQADARCPSSKQQSKQQQQQRQRQRRLQNDSIFNLRILREFRFVHFVYTFRNIPNKICKGQTSNTSRVEYIKNRCDKESTVSVGANVEVAFN